ncbi:hypothetical protein BHM03_00051751, partial [Ensete ventricosum]
NSKHEDSPRNFLYSEGSDHLFTKKALTPLAPICAAAVATLRKRRHCTPSAWAAPAAGATALGWHLVGRGAAPCGLATGSHHLWPSSGRCLCPQAPPMQVPTMPAGGHTYWQLPLQGGFGYGQLPPCRGPWPQPAWPWLAGLAWGWSPLLLDVLVANALNAST